MAITFLTRIVETALRRSRTTSSSRRYRTRTLPTVTNIELDRAYNKITLTIKESGREVTYETGMVGDLDDLSSMLLSRGIKIEGRIIEENSTWVEAF